LPSFTAAPHNRSLPDPCTSRRQKKYKQTMPARVFMLQTHQLVAATPHCHISVLRRIGMAPKPAHHAPPYTLRQSEQAHGQNLPKLIPAAWTWFSYENHFAMNCNCRNTHFGHAPPHRLMPTTVNCRYGRFRYLPPRTCALRTRYGTGNVPAKTRHPQVHSLQGQTLPRGPSAIYSNPFQAPYSPSQLQDVH